MNYKISYQLFLLLVLSGILLPSFLYSNSNSISNNQNIELLPSPEWFTSKISPNGDLDRKLNYWVKKKGEVRYQGQNLSRAYLVAIYYRYLLRDEIKVKGISSRKLKDLKDRWVDKAIRLAKQSLDDVSDDSPAKAFYQSNLASLYAIKITYSSFPFLLWYVKRFQEMGDLGVKSFPQNFQLKVEQTLNYAVSSYEFYPDGKKVLDDNLTWLKNTWEEMKVNSKSGKDYDFNFDLLQRARLAAAEYYIEQVEDMEGAKSILSEIEQPVVDSQAKSQSQVQQPSMKPIRIQSKNRLLKLIDDK